MGKEIPELKIYMLGRFAVTCGDQPISFRQNPGTKAMKLLQLLLHSTYAANNGEGYRGISRTRLLEDLFGREELSNAANNLRVTAHRLRRILTEAGLPDYDYIKIEDGFYRWESPMPVWLDVAELQEKLESSGPFGTALANFGRNMKESMKQFVIPRSMIFEQLGILCTAPIDGHDIGALRETLSTVLATDGPVLMHVVTKKGAGYEPASRNPERFHGVGPYDIATGELVKKEAAAPSYTDVFGQAIVREARQNPDIVAITAAMKDGTGLAPFAEEFPDRFVDAGIAEEHAVGMAAGLAAGGKKPVVAIYSTFLQRAIDQIVIDNALPNLDVVFAIDRAGVVGEDGPTHHGMFDIAYMRMIPHMRVLAPSDEAELVHALHTALALGGPFAIRYPRGAAEGAPVPDEPEVLEEGRARVVRDGGDVAVLAFGRMVSRALGAADILAQRGIDARVVDMRWVKPLDAEEIARAAQTKLVVTVEGGVVAGGAGEGVLGEMARQGLCAPVLNLGIQDRYVPQGKVDLLLHDLGLDAEGIASSVEKRLARLGG